VVVPATFVVMTDGPLWSGRFSTPPAPEAEALGRSIDVDRTLAAEDVRAGTAHVSALRDAGLLTDDEATELVGALAQVRDAMVAGTFAFDPADEDIHSAVERGVTDLLGDVGAKLHAGRSRNDLVATDVRLHLIDLAATAAAEVRAVGRALVVQARAHVADPMPGTTHGRPAQPVTVGHHLCAHAWALARDLDRSADWRRRANVSPLGAGALATSTLGLDPAATAERLGFDRAFDNSLDAVSDRDVVQEAVAAATICGTHLSRLAADLLRWTDPALGWAELDEAYSTGSSMMPQKRNPDTAELARAKAARIGGDFATLTAMLQGLPLGYQRDLQEDKEPAFDALETLAAVARALVGAVATLRIDVTAMREACADPGLYATDVAEALVVSGVPFREAHRRTGELLRSLADDGRTLADLDADDWMALGAPDGAALLDPDRSIAARTAAGGPARASVEAPLAALGALFE
jgi:argininosuccinate lyase